MKFAQNYSLPAVELLEAGEIDFDFFKCPDWPDLIPIASRYRPVVVHFDLAAGRNTLSSVDWDFIERLLVQTGTKHVNLHFYPSIIAHGTVEQALEAAREDIEAVARRFGPDRVIVENLPYPMPEGDMPPAGADPQVIGSIITETGCGLLLDISHAAIAARNQGLDERGYLCALPVDRIREMHLTGVDWHDGKLDDHLAMTDLDWVMLDWVVEQIRSKQWAEPDYLAFEYGGIGEVFAWRNEREVIRQQAPRIFKRIR